MQATANSGSRRLPDFSPPLPSTNPIRRLAFACSRLLLASRSLLSGVQARMPSAVTGGLLGGIAVSPLDAMNAVQRRPMAWGPRQPPAPAGAAPLAGFGAFEKWAVEGRPPTRTAFPIQPTRAFTVACHSSTQASQGLGKTLTRIAESSGDRLPTTRRRPPTGGLLRVTRSYGELKESECLDARSATLRDSPSPRTVQPGGTRRRSPTLCCRSTSSSSDRAAGSPHCRCC